MEISLCLFVNDADFFCFLCIPGLRGLCVSELLERLEEVERQIRGFSEELIDQLAVREELDYEKEVKNTFISAIIDVQNRQKEHRELLKKKRKIKTTGGVQRSDRSHVPGTVRMIITNCSLASPHKLHRNLHRFL